jgi:hypothetical protein
MTKVQIPEFIGGKRLFVRPVTERHAQDLLDAQLAKAHRDALDLFMEQADAMAEVEALISGAKPFGGSGVGRHASLAQTASALDNAAYNVESALLTGDFEAWADYSGVEPVNIPRQFARAGVPAAPAEQPAAPDDDDDVRFPCGF